MSVSQSVGEWPGWSFLVSYKWIWYILPLEATTAYEESIWKSFTSNRSTKKSKIGSFYFYLKIHQKIGWENVTSRRHKAKTLFSQITNNMDGFREPTVSSETIILLFFMDYFFIWTVVLIFYIDYTDIEYIFLFAWS